MKGQSDPKIRYSNRVSVPSSRLDLREQSIGNKSQTGLVWEIALLYKSLTSAQQCQTFLICARKSQYAPVRANQSYTAIQLHIYQLHSYSPVQLHLLFSYTRLFSYTTTQQDMKLLRHATIQPKASRNPAAFQHQFGINSSRSRSHPAAIQQWSSSYPSAI